jgi:hypothetical protein
MSLISNRVYQQGTTGKKQTRDEFEILRVRSKDKMSRANEIPNASIEYNYFCIHPSCTEDLVRRVISYSRPQGEVVVTRVGKSMDSFNRNCPEANWSGRGLSTE